MSCGLTKRGEASCETVGPDICPELRIGGRNREANSVLKRLTTCAWAGLEGDPAPFDKIWQRFRSRRYRLLEPDGKSRSFNAEQGANEPQHND